MYTDTQVVATETYLIDFCRRSCKACGFNFLLEIILINDLSIGLISIWCLLRLKKEIVPSNIPVKKLKVINIVN